MKRVLSFLFAAAAVSIAFAQAYQDPTFHQVERLIRAASGDTTPVPNNPSMYGKPTFSQVERLIQAVSGCRNPGVEDLAYGSRYLSIWDCATGLPLSNMSNTTYRAGDFYIVGNTDTNGTSSVAASGIYHHLVGLVNASTYSSQVCPMVMVSFTNTTATAYTSFNDVYSAAREVYNGRSRMPAVGVIYRQDSDTEYDVVYGADPNASSTYGLGLCDVGGTTAWFLTGAESVFDYVTDNSVRYVHTISGLSGSTASGGAYSGVSLTITNTVPEAIESLSDIACPAIMAGIKPDNVLQLASGSIQPDPSADVVSAYFSIDDELGGIMVLQDDHGGTGDAYKATDITSVSDTVTTLAPAGYTAASDKLFRPSGASYASGSASSEEESAIVMPNDTYWYNGSSWVLISIASNMLGSSSSPGGAGGGIGMNPAASTPVADWAKVGNVPPITGVQLNGTMLSTNEDRVAIGTILSCSPFPEGTDVGKKLNPWVTIPVSTLKFCKSLATNKNVVAGMTYYGSVSLSEEIQDVVPGLSEVTVHCLRADRTDPDPNDNTSTNGCVILMLERTSTNTGMRHWMCAYEYFGYNYPSYPWSNHNVYPDGKPSYGTTNMPWYGILFKPVPGHNNGPVPLERKYTAASLQELDDTATSVVQEGSNTVIAMTGIHQGERTMNPQYDRGNWTEPALSLTNCTVEIGVNAHATETSGSSQAIAIGRDSLSAGSATVAVGPNAFAEKNQAIALGWRANAVGSHAISIGTAKKSGEDYYSNGVVNVYSDLNLAEGDYSIAMGYNAKAVGTDSIALGDMAKAGAYGAVQIGFGTNNVAHTLKFENVTIVKNGQVVGATPEPESKDPSIGTTTDDMTLTVKPGSMTTVLPATKLDPGSELAIHCTGMRNYTVYLPNEENVRQGLPVNVMFEIQRGTAQAVIGTNVFTRLPIRLKAEQPYSGLAVVDTTTIDDGYDWTPAVTNCLLAYNGTASKFYCPSGTQKSLEGVSLQAGKVYKLAYPTSVSGGSATNTVDLMTMPADKPFMDATFYGEVGAVEYSATAVTPYTYTDGDDDYVDVKITYETVNGACTFDTRVKVEGIE